MKIYLIFSVILVSTSYNYAKETTNELSVKSQIVQEIMGKVSKIALKKLSEVSDEKKEAILKKIQAQLLLKSKDLVDGPKYVSIIMKEFRKKAYTKNDKSSGTKKEKNNTEDKGTDDGENKSNEEENNGSENETDLLRVRNNNDVVKSEKNSTQRKVFDQETKQKIISDIANKIDIVAKTYLKDSQTLEQKKAILKKIESRILDSSKRKHIKIHDQHNDLRAYIQLITQGLELSMNRLTLKTRRMEGKPDLNETEISNDINANETQHINLKHINRYKDYFSDILSETSLDPRCTDVVEGVCLRIESLRKLPCGDGKYVGLEQLCDGAFDCWNEADETDCTERAIDKVERSINLMSDVDESITSKCLQPLYGGAIFTYHHTTLLHMLYTELDFLKNYESPSEKFNVTSKEKVDSDKFVLKKVVGDATSLINSLSSALDINLCLPSDKSPMKNKLSRRAMDNELVPNIKVESLTPAWTPKSCVCNNDVCLSDDCDPRCKRICWQKYSLNRWRCQSLSGNTSIPMSLICDGKLDCFDETDESQCSTGFSADKFRANALYNELIDLLSLKALSSEYEHSRTKIVALTGLTRQLQKLTISAIVDPHTIKIVRDQFFNMLINIYTDAMRNSNLKELDKTHELLVLMNEKLVDALKHSHTGNNNVIPTGGCFCRNGTCAQPRCSPRCKSVCAAEPLFIKYSCNINNLTVPLKALCNGKKECPNEQDEKNCKNEVCRSHHLILLRHKLQTAGVSIQGTPMGDAIDSWKSKVMTTLKILESRDRPTHVVLEDTITTVLHDLVSTYASMDDSIKNTAERIYKEFVTISDTVKEALKSCSH